MEKTHANGFDWRFEYQLGSVFHSTLNPQDQSPDDQIRPFPIPADDVDLTLAAENNRTDIGVQLNSNRVTSWELKAQRLPTAQPGALPTTSVFRCPVLSGRLRVS